jgi:hypothetical protein
MLFKIILFATSKESMFSLVSLKQLKRVELKWYSPNQYNHAMFCCVYVTNENSCAWALFMSEVNRKRNQWGLLQRVERLHIIIYAYSILTHFLNIGPYRTNDDVLRFGAYDN